VYQGREVDKQTHLGFDLARSRHAHRRGQPRPYRVRRQPRIYGNCVIIDHGMGVQSLYAHLSSIGVKPGDVVEKEAQIGRSGMTGLAGGDHLHFTMLVNGQMVNPIEWWDPTGSKIGSCGSCARRGNGMRVDLAGRPRRPLPHPLCVDSGGDRSGGRDAGRARQTFRRGLLEARDRSVEPDGTFQDDNFTSNETEYAEFAALLEASGPRGGAYIGVGPEQNFSYMVAIRPKISFIRRHPAPGGDAAPDVQGDLRVVGGPRGVHLALFSLPRPAALDAHSTIEEIWRAFPTASGTDSCAMKRPRGGQGAVGRTHRFALSAKDLSQIEYVSRAFFELARRFITVVTIRMR